MLKAGGQEITALRLGGAEMQRAYLGEMVVFEKVKAYTITAAIDPAGSGTVTGAGQYKEGESATIRAVPGEGYSFTAWQEDGVVVSTSAEYTFTVTGDRTLAARFEAAALRLNWQTATLPSSSNPYDICHGGGKFVMVGPTPPLYSTDGVSWAKGTSASANVAFMTGIYGGGKFVQVAASYARSSADGVNWTNHSGLANIAKVGLVYGNGVYLSFPNSSSTTYYYSTTGTSWTVESGSSGLPAAGKYKCSAYGNGRFVIIASGGGQALYSADGLKWTQVELPVSANWSKLVYGGGKFVAVASGSDDAVYSPDGAAWYAAKMPASDSWIGAAYGGGVFAAIAANSNQAAYSKDGISWRLANDTLPSALKWAGIAYGGGKFVAVASGSDIAAYAVI